MTGGTKGIGRTIVIVSCIAESYHVGLKNETTGQKAGVTSYQTDITCFLCSEVITELSVTIVQFFSALCLLSVRVTDGHSSVWAYIRRNHFPSHVVHPKHMQMQ